MKTRLLLLSIICSFASLANAAPPVVSGVTANQRTGTKLVDITYNLAMDTGQKAFVELWFSPDNGLNFPIRCVDVNGSVDANVTAGNKTVTWNAETDWNQQFTQNGKIRVIATYGNQPSGFSGSGGSGNSGSGSSSSGQADASMVSVFWDVYYALDSAGGGSQYFDYSNWYTHSNGPSLTKFYVDPAEVTNTKWDEIAQWALANGYSGLPLAPVAEAGDLPRTNISFWEAIKWCNARSEKDGLTPIYYMDINESTGDMNGNGIIENGNDTFYPYGADDTNQNGMWDTGENFNDINGNGIFEPKEYEDFNGNSQYDSGLTQVFRSGAEITMPSAGGGGGGGIALGMNHFSKNHANGYRLPDGVMFMKMATGGTNQKKWPWGDSSPDSYPQFASEYRVTTGMGSMLNGPSNASSRPANGLGIKDIIGNVAEWSGEAFVSGGVGNQLTATVYGGSYVGLTDADGANPGGDGVTQFSPQPGMAGTANSLFDLELQGAPTAKSPAVGFRCVIGVWSN